MIDYQNFTAIIQKDEDIFTSLCPELDIASQGDSIDEAKYNLKEAIELFFETASPNEIINRIKKDIYITNISVATSS